MIIKSNHKTKPDSSPHSRKSVLIPRFWPSNDSQPEIIRTGSFTLTTSPSEAVRAKLTSVSRGGPWNRIEAGLDSTAIEGTALSIASMCTGHQGKSKPWQGRGASELQPASEKRGVSQQQLLSAA